MPEKDERRSRRYVGLAVVVLACVACSAQSPPPTPSPIVESLNTYLDDSHRARLPDGRMINIVCKGEGSPTVVFTAGLGDWSVVWGQVQPRISERTRTCAWDRPGFGFSSPSKAAQTVLTTTSDLRAALAAAGIAAPYVLVGHSFGGFETLVFTDRHRADVAGIVLVDPSTPRQLERFARVLGDSSAMQRTLEAQTATIERCVDAARAGTLATGSGDPDNCLGLNPAFPAALTTALTQAGSDPERFVTQVSLLENVVRSNSLVADEGRNYGDLPFIVLSASEVQAPPPSMRELVNFDPAVLQAEMIRAHAELARLSSRGEHQIVADTSHYIHLIRPPAVIEAIGNVLDAVVASPLEHLER